ncbi:MAG: DUF4328 domain-containing protein [Actinomycetota bacterium]|nr:DUF4328 domain-containing protein [Actinomycetota bacterium]
MSDLPPPPPPHSIPPPGYVAYGGQGSVAQGTQKIAGLAKALAVLLIIMVPFQVLGIFSTITLTDKARELIDGSITESEFEDATQANLGSLAGLLIIPVAVLTMIWMFRMASNLRALGRRGATWAPGWGIGGWFVPPCVLYVVPWLMFKELWRGSDPDCGYDDPNWKKGPVAPIITIWWVLYGLLPLAGLATSANTISQLTNAGDMETIAEQFDKFATFNIAMAVIGVGTTVVYFVLVRQLSARHMAATRESASR